MFCSTRKCAVLFLDRGCVADQPQRAIMLLRLAFSTAALRAAKENSYVSFWDTQWTKIQIAAGDS